MINEGTLMEMDISHIWMRFNRRWLLTGSVSGFGAGLLALALASLISVKTHHGALYPLQLIGATWKNSFSGKVGFVIHFTLAAFFGLVFAQSVLETSRKGVLIFLGTLAGLAAWLFWSAMFMPAFNEPMTYLLPKTFSLFLHVVFGFVFGVLVVLLRPVLCGNK